MASCFSGRQREESKIQEKKKRNQILSRLKKGWKDEGAEEVIVGGDSGDEPAGSGTGLLCSSLL